MKLAAVTSLLKYYPLPEALRLIAEAGYEGVELWGGLPHGYIEDFFNGAKINDGTIKRCKNLLSESGLAPVAFLPEQCFYPVNYLITESPPFDGQQLALRSKQYFSKAINVASTLEIPKLIVTTPFWGWQVNGERFVHSRSKPLEFVIDILGKLAQEAQCNGITLVLEPLTHLETTAVETLDDLLSVLNSVNSPHLAAMIDTGHINVTANALGKESTRYFYEHVSSLGTRLQHLHVDDNYGDQDAHLLPGEGNFNFEEAFRALKEYGYDGYLSVELMMFGKNPVPPTPFTLLLSARDHILDAWNRAG